MSVAQRIARLEADMPVLWPEPEPKRAPLEPFFRFWAFDLLRLGPDAVAAAIAREFVVTPEQIKALVVAVYRRTEAREWPAAFNCQLPGHLARALARDGTRFPERGCRCLPSDANPLPHGPEYLAWEATAWCHLSAWSAWQPYEDEGGPEPVDCYLGRRS